MWIKHCTAFKHFFHAVRGPLTSAITSALQINCTCCTTSSCVDSFLFVHVFESTSLPCRRPNTPGRKTKTTHAVIENFVVKGKKEGKKERKKLHLKWKEKNYSNEWMNEKPQKCMYMLNVLAFLSKPERTYWSLTPQLETVIIEVSTVQALRWRGNPRHLPSMNWTYIGWHRILQWPN